MHDQAALDPDGANAVAVLHAYRTHLAQTNAFTADEAEVIVPEGLAVSHRMYLLLVRGVARAYPRVVEADIEKLSVAAYGVYRMCLEADTLVDDGDTTVLSRLLQHQAVVTDTLRDVFGGDEPLREWRQRWDEQWAAVHSELQLSKREFVEEAEFRRLAVGKSRAVALVVDWLERLQPQPQRATRLRESLAGLHVGMQWVDDLRDFEDDAKRGHLSIAHVRSNALLATRGVDAAGIDPELAKRMFYAAGGAETLLDEALTELNNAAQQARLADCDWLELVIERFHQRAQALANAVSEQRLSAIARLQGQQTEIPLRSTVTGIRAGIVAAPEKNSFGLNAGAARSVSGSDAPTTDAAQTDTDKMEVLGKLYIQARPKEQWLVGSESGRHAIVGSEMLAVLKAMQGRNSKAAAFNAYRICGGALEKADFDSSAEQGLRLLGPDAVQRFQNLPIRIHLLNEGATDKLATPFIALFKLPLAAVCALAVFAGVWAAWLGTTDQTPVSLSWAYFALVVALVIAGVFVHEVGHVAALRRYKQPSGGIGFGLYYGFLPMLYADLSRAWRLSRLQRVVVNLGGSWLQLGYAGILAASSLVVPDGELQTVLWMAATGSAVLALIQCLPLPGTDGYWVVADSFDQPQLAKYESSLWREASVGKGSAWLRLAYLIASTSALAVLLFFALRPALNLVSNVLAWLTGQSAVGSLATHAGWVALIVSTLLLRRLYVQLRSFVLGSAQRS